MNRSTMGVLQPAQMGIPPTNRKEKEKKSKAGRRKEERGGGGEGEREAGKHYKGRFCPLSDHVTPQRQAAMVQGST